MCRRGTFARLAVVAFALTALFGRQAARAAHTSFSLPLTGGVDLFTDFPSCYGGSFGPVGMVSDSTSFYVDDSCNQTTYRFPSSGGSAAAPAASAVNGFDMGLAIQQGNYYGTIQSGGVYRFNPVTLARGALIASLPGARGLVADPLSGDLFVSMCNHGETAVYAVKNPDGSSPVVTPFATVPAPECMDGLAIASDGSRVFAVDTGDGTGNDHVLAWDRNGNQVLSIPVSGGADGIAIARGNVISNGIDVSNNIFVNTNSGNILRIDTSHGNAISVVAESGSRGDFVTVGPDGCLYATQSTTVERISPCFFQAPLLKTALSTDPAIAYVGASPMIFFPNLNAHLAAAGLPVVGQLITFSAPNGGAVICSGVTNANGTASCAGSLQATLDLGLGYTASFAGASGYLPSSAHGPLARVLSTDVL